MGIKTKTPKLTLNYANIKGEGLEKQDGEGREFKVTCLVEKGSKEDKEMQKELKRLSKEFDIDLEDMDSLFYKEYVIPDPDSKRNTAKKIKDWKETDYMMFVAKTRTEYANGNRKQVKVYDAKGLDLTQDYEESEKYLAKGSRVIVYYTADHYEVKGNEGLTAYLDKVQIIKPVWGGDEPVEAVDDDEAEDVDFNSNLPKEEKKKKKKKKKKGE